MAKNDDTRRKSIIHDRIDGITDFEFDRRLTRDLSFEDIPDFPMYVSALVFLSGLGIIVSAMI